VSCTSLARLAPVLVAGLLVLVGCGNDQSFGVADVDDEASGTTASGDEAVAQHRFVIPPGTGEDIDAGQPVEIIPADLTVAVGEIIELVNEDDRGHIVGPFFVGAKETLRQQFTSPGVYEGICTVHPSGEVKLTVEQA